MQTKSNRYDGELRMFVDQPREPNLAHLRFLRWLAERDRLEHPAAGAPAGQYAGVTPIEDRAAA